MHYLNICGYETTLFGIQHEIPLKDMDELKYSRIYRYPGSYSVEWDLYNSQKAAEYLLERKEKPFFLSMGLWSAHRPYPEISGDINPNCVLPPHPLPDLAVSREDMAGFITSVQAADKCIGIVMDALERSGLENETVVIFTTDHGIAFPKMKCSLYDTGTGVSLIIKYPGNKMKGRALDCLVSQIDIFPTLCDIPGLRKPDWLQGCSMLPLLEGSSERIRDEVFSEVTYHAAYEPMRSIRTERYKLIKYFGEFCGNIPANIDGCPSKTFLINHGFLEEEREKEMLFDLYMDPAERTNLINNDRYREVYMQLARRLEQWMKDTNDPLLSGKAPKPEGTIVNKLSCIEHTENDFE